MLESESEQVRLRLPQDGKRYLQFGDYCLDRHRQELFKQGTRMKLQGKPYQVLLTLLEKPGLVITREELRVRLWPSDTNVNFDANVNTTVNKLRQALGDCTEQPIYIETIPRKGYSFVALVEHTDAPALPPLRHPTADSPRDGRPIEPRSPANLHPRAHLWMTVGVIAMVLAGILLGAGIATFWIDHIMRFPPLH